MTSTGTGEIPTSGWASAEFAPISTEQQREVLVAEPNVAQVEQPPKATTTPVPAGSSSLLIKAPTKTAYETLAKMLGCKLVFVETPELEQALSREVTARISTRLNLEDRSAVLALTLISVRSKTAFRLSAPDDGGAPQDWTLTVSAKPGLP